jgi:O-antigen/teichoic acid export membrane protein
LINNSLIYLIVRLGNGLLAIATLAIFSRLLSPSDYGFYALVMSAGAVLSSVLFQWLEFAIARFYPSSYENPDEIVATITYWFWASTALAAMFCIAGILFHATINVDPVMVILLFFLTVALGRYTLVLQIVNSQSAPIYYGMLSWFKSLFALLAGVWLISLGKGSNGALVAFIGALIFSVIVVNPKPKIGLPEIRVNSYISSDMFKYGLPMVITVLASSIVDVADRFIIGKMLGISNVAPYALAYDFLQLIIGPAMHIFMLTSFPNIVTLFDRNEKVAVSICVRKLGANLLGYGLPLVLILSFLSKDICIVLLDGRYQQKAEVMLPWLSVAIYLGVFKSYFLDLVFQLHQATKIQVYLSFFMAITNLGLNLFLMPRYGLIAAAWVAMITYLFGAIASWFLGRKLFQLPNLIDVFLKTGLVCIILALVMWFMGSFVGVAWLIFKIIFLLLIYFLLEFTIDTRGVRN